MKICVKKNLLFRFSRCECTEIRRRARIEADERLAAAAAGLNRKRAWPDFGHFDNTPWIKKKKREPSAAFLRYRKSKNLEIEVNGESRVPLLNAINIRIQKLRVRNEDPESSDDEEFSMLEKKFGDHPTFQKHHALKRVCCCKNLTRAVLSGFLFCDCRDIRPDKTHRNDLILGVCVCNKSLKCYKEATNTLYKLSLHNFFHRLFRLLKKRDFANLVWEIIEIRDLIIPDVKYSMKIHLRRGCGSVKIFEFPIHKLLDFILSYALCNPELIMNFEIIEPRNDEREFEHIGWKLKEFIIRSPIERSILHANVDLKVKNDYGYTISEIFEIEKAKQCLWEKFGDELILTDNELREIEESKNYEWEDEDFSYSNMAGSSKNSKPWIE